MGELAFDSILWKGGKVAQPLEPDLVQSQQNLDWCERLVLVYPMWWGTFPARLKGWLDRVLEPGFAYRYHDKGPFWDKLLTGRHAHIIRTSDAPSLWVRLVYRDCDLICLRRAVLGFCGIGTRRIWRIGRVKDLDPAGRTKAIAAVARMV